MWNNESRAGLREYLRTLRTIMRAMIGSVIALTILAFRAPVPGDRPADASPVVSLVAMGMGLLILVAIPILSRVIVASGRRKIAAGQFTVAGAPAPRVAEFLNTSEGKL